LSFEEIRAEHIRDWTRFRTFLEARFDYINDDSDDPGIRASNILALLLAEGSAKSKEEAILQATAAAAVVASDLGSVKPRWKEEGRTTRIEASRVAAVRRARATLKKLARLEAIAATTAATHTDSATTRYIYARVESMRYVTYYYYRYRVIRETKRFIFVCPGPDRKSHGEDWILHWRDVDALGRGAVRLDRAWIGKGGEGLPWSAEGKLGLSGYSHSDLFWSEDDLPPLPAPSEAGHLQEGDVDMELLGLMPGDWSTSTLKKAYREKAKILHPDAGGDTAEFQALTDAYERLLQRLSVAPA